MESVHHSLSRPDCNNTADVPSFTLRTAHSVIPFVSDLCGVDVQWFQDISPHKTCQIPRNCQCKWLLASSSTQGTSSGSYGSPEKFLFCTGRNCNHRVAKPCTTTAYRWLFLDSLFSLRTLWSNQNVPLWARLYQHVFCKKPFLFSSSSRNHNVGPSECGYIHCAYPNPVPLLLVAPLEVHEMLWKCLDFLALGFSKALLKYFHQPNSLWTPADSPASHVIDRSVLLCVLHFLFSVPSGSCSGFHRSSSLVLPLLSCTGFSVYLLTSKYRILW